MNRMTGAKLLAVLLVVWAVAPAVANAAQDNTENGPRRAYKPAERRQQSRQAADADAAPAAGRESSTADDITVPPGVTDPEGFKRDVLAARAQRDKDLKDAEKETDRRKFEKRKEQIFAQYATILAEMREKYVAQQGDKTATPTQQARNSKRNNRTPVTERYSRPETNRKSARRDGEEVTVPDDPPPARKTAKSNKRKAGNDDASGGSLAEAQQRLDDENKRHETELEQLNKQLAAAESSDNRREVRKVQRAIDKENTTYDAKKTLLERRVKELGGSVSGTKDTAKSDVR